MTAPEIVVLDYEMSNLRSATKALERLGARVRVARDAGEAAGGDAVVLPGVGHFGEAMRRIRAAGLDRPVTDAVADRRPVLGICLGLQLLFERSEEAPGSEGLGVLAGTVRRIEAPERKLPHIGWSTAEWIPGAPLAPPGDDPADRTYYFVHGYAVAPSDPALALATATHGAPFCAAAGRDGLVGVQFHPEKSSRAGLALLARWLGGVAEGAPGLAAPAARTPAPAASRASASQPGPGSIGSGRA